MVHHVNPRSCPNAGIVVNQVICEGNVQTKIRKEVRRNVMIHPAIVMRKTGINQSSRETNHGQLDGAKGRPAKLKPQCEILKLRCVEVLYLLMVLS